MGPRNRFQGMNSASLCTCSLAGRYDNPLPPRFLAPIDSFKIPALILRREQFDPLLVVVFIIFFCLQMKKRNKYFCLILQRRRFLDGRSMVNGHVIFLQNMRHKFTMLSLSKVLGALLYVRFSAYLFQFSFSLFDAFYSSLGYSH